MTVDLRNWVRYAISGNPVVGADVYAYAAVTTHPNTGSVVAQTTTDASGMFSFTGLADNEYDVKVSLNGKIQWYKGLAKTSVIIQPRNLSSLCFGSVSGYTGGPSSNGAATTASRNDHVHGHATPNCRVSKTATQSISSGSWQAVTWPSEVFDTGTMHDNVTNNSRITVPIAGKYLCHYLLEVATGGAGSWMTLFYQNGAQVGSVFRTPITTASPNIHREVLVLNCAANDYIEVFVTQDSGGPLNVGPVVWANGIFSVSWLGE